MRDQRQRECIAAIKAKDYNCYIEACVGFGKTIMALRLMASMLEKKVLKPNSRILFQTSGTTLLAGFIEECAIYEEIFDTKLDLQIETYCYQSRQLTKDTAYDYVINDEFYYPGEVYAADLDLYKGKALYMSGTVSSTSTFMYMGVFITKKEWIESKVPLAYKYSINDGQKDGVVTNFKTTILYHNLSTMRYGKIWTNQTFEFSEKEFYKKCIEQTLKYRFFNPDDHLDRITEESKTKNMKRVKDPNVLKYFKTFDIEKAYILGKLETEEANYTKKRNHYGSLATLLIANCPSKIAPLRAFIKNLPGRTVVWARHLDFLDSVIGKKNVIRTNELEEFNALKTNVIGTSKKIIRGVTPVLVDNLVMCLPTGSNTELEQLIGRVIRTDTRVDKVANLFICITLDTYAEHWFRNGLKKGDSYIDLNIVNSIHL